MKHKFFVAMLLLALALTAGCAAGRAPVPPAELFIWSDKMLDLMETVNAEHRAVVKPVLHEATLLQRYTRDTSQYSPIYTIAPRREDGLLSPEQAKNDINMLIYHLQTGYGPYEYYGGDVKFEEARLALCRACDEYEALTQEDLLSLFRTHLSFITDCHFSLNSSLLHPLVYTHHYREVEFAKTVAGYERAEDHKQVRTVTGFEDLDSVFRRSVSDRGELVYYPVTTFLHSAGYDPEVEGEAPFLEVLYDDGSRQLLTPFADRIDFDRERQLAEVYYKQSLPVLYARRMGFDEAGDESAQEFLAWAEALKDEPCLVLNLRFNGGGNLTLPYKWIHAYTGEKPIENHYSLTYLKPYQREAMGNTNNPYYVSQATMAEYCAEREIADGLLFSGRQESKFIEQENLLLVITGKHTASAGEAMICLLHNVKNVLFVGDLTMGCLINSGSTLSSTLPCSLIDVRFGSTFRIFPEGDYFAEGRGFQPDLWVPACLAEELAIKLVLSGN